ncbi:MAG TPA: hypothetical protein VHT91_19835 [Kofleriaceae bacterium]|jgi:hypothetical protein|nr:hypothetical protein [Kofleriaceae bacterium]
MQRMTRMTLVAVALLAAAPGCKKETAMTGGSNTGSSPAPVAPTPPAPAPASPAPAATAPPAPAAASGPYTLPAGARTIDEHAARKADATALGGDLALRFVDKLGEDNDGSRRVDEMLVLSGASAMIVEIAYDLDDSAAHKGAADGALVLNAPLSPPHPFSKTDAPEAPNPLPFAGPLLYVRHGKGGAVAVAHDGDTITAWRLSIQHGEGGEGQVIDWFVQAKLQLAPGATVKAL